MRDGAIPDWTPMVIGSLFFFFFFFWPLIYSVPRVEMLGWATDITPTNRVHVRYDDASIHPRSHTSRFLLSQIEKSRSSLPCVTYLGCEWIPPRTLEATYHMRLATQYIEQTSPLSPAFCFLFKVLFHFRFLGVEFGRWSSEFVPSHVRSFFPTPDLL